MPATEKLDTHQKPLALNLDPSKFGSFAEIGADITVIAITAISATPYDRPHGRIRYLRLQLCQRTNGTEN